MNDYPEIKKIIDLALEEDIRSGDITSEICIPDNASLFGKLVLKESGVIAGLPFFAYAFKKISPESEFTPFVQEGTYHHAGTLLGTISGPALSVMIAERTALNLIQHTSGIATKTEQFVHLISNFKCKILDTRRTLPNLRALEQYAVRMGGGISFRLGLDDRFVVKRHHLAFIARKTQFPIREAVRRVRSKNPTERVEIEVISEEQFEEAFEANVNLMILERMPPDLTRRCVEKAKTKGITTYIECTGMITPETIPDYAETGVDGIVISDLAFAPALEIRLLKSL